MRAPVTFTTATVSVLAHAAAILVGAWWVSTPSGAPRDAASLRPKVVEIEIAPPDIVGSGAREQGGAPAPELEPPEAADTGLGLAPSRPDLRHGGRGGVRHGERALNLSDSVDGLTLATAALNRLDQSQIQRVRTGSSRRSHDDRRATRKPAELTFVATGDGARPLRRPSAAHDPARGVLGSTEPSAQGGRPGAPAFDLEQTGSLAGSERAGAPTRAAPAGVDAPFRRAPASRRAAVMMARPDVPQARPAVPANERGRVTDSVDSTDQVATAVQALITASALGGASGQGPGGSAGGGSPAAGGLHGKGSRSQASGSGYGGEVGPDRLVMGYLRGIRRRVDVRRAFPYWATAEGRGGLAVLALTLSADGALRSVQVVRPSGIREYDENLVTALRRIGSFGKVPPGLLERQQGGVMTVRIGFDAVNPAVGREGPGPGGRR